MEQMRIDRTITSEWMAGLPKSGQHRSSKGATSLAKSSCSSICISRRPGSMKSRSHLLVNWKRVESLRQRPSGSSIATSYQ